jgi:hypothetical protein
MLCALLHKCASCAMLVRPTFVVHNHVVLWMPISKYTMDLGDYTDLKDKISWQQEVHWVFENCEEPVRDKFFLLSLM